MAAGDTHLVFHVRGVDQRRSDGGFVRQRLAQEGVVSFTWATNKNQSVSGDSPVGSGTRRRL